MNASDVFRKVLSDDGSVKAVEDDIYSVFPDVSQKHQYDRRAALYDLIVGNSLYNRVMWGASLPNYISFAGQALASNKDGFFLDAGCGSLLFTAPTYLKSSRPIIAFDQSLSMLRRARKRLIKLSGSMPENILLLQADLTDLPFKTERFQTILCLNVFHHLENISVLVQNFRSLLRPDGNLYLTSLILNQRFIGDRYLKLLYAAGDFARPRIEETLQNILEESLEQKVTCQTDGNMAFVSTNLK
jgi:SAM-dependent methyltransferase